MTQIGYYPGCALHGSSNDYERSVRVCLGALEIQLRELDDWICCGATAAHSINRKLSVALPARNLALAERDGCAQLLAPCPMCSMELIKAQSLISADVALREEMSRVVEMPIKGETRVVNLIQIIQSIGLDTLKEAAKIPLEGFKVACYYGCLLTRPAKTLQFDDCEQPSSMETIIEALGGEAVDWNFKTECCGAGMTMSNEETVLDLSNKILTNAAAHGADCLCVACPMCHVNLDMKQASIEKRYGTRHDMPVYYLSDLVGMALGLTPEALGIDKHFIVKR